jgi:aspartate aminotransferase
MADCQLFTLAPRVAQLRRSPTAAISDRIRELTETGRTVVNLGEGELDFDTPAHIKDAAHRAIERGATKYTSVAGTRELKQAIVRKFEQENGIAYRTTEVIAGPGAKSLILNALLATVSEGDEVIVPAPYWVSYPDMVAFAGGTPRIVPCSEHAGWKLSAEILAEAITPRTKWLILNSPNNPTGATYSAADLKKLADVLLKHPHVLVLSDDIYEHILYDCPFATLVQVEPGLRERTLVVNGVSKAYSMTGWRLGFAAGPQKLVDALEILQSQSTSNPSSISQAAAAHALEAGTDFMDQWRDVLRIRRDVVVSTLSQTPGLRVAAPEGAFYAFINCAGLLGAVRHDGLLIESDFDVTNYLLDEAGVGVVHGAAFGASPYFRVAYAIDTDVLCRACDAIQAACIRLVSSQPARRSDTDAQAKIG